MKEMTKETQMQANGGAGPWIGACTTCGRQFSAKTQAELQQLGLAHYQKYYSKKAPHRWVYVQRGY